MNADVIIFVLVAHTCTRIYTHKHLHTNTCMHTVRSPLQQPMRQTTGWCPSYSLMPILFHPGVYAKFKGTPTPRCIPVERYAGGGRRAVTLSRAAPEIGPKNICARIEATMAALQTISCPRGLIHDNSVSCVVLNINWFMANEANRLKLKWECGKRVRGGDSYMRRRHSRTHEHD